MVQLRRNRDSSISGAAVRRRVGEVSREEGVGDKAAASIRGRIFALVALPLVIPMVFMVFFVPYRQERSLLEGRMTSAKALSLVFATNASALMQFDDKRGLSALLRSIREDKEVVFAVARAADGRLIASEGNTDAAPGMERISPDFSAREEGDLLHLSAPVRGAEGNLIGVLQFGFSTKRISDEGRNFRLMALLLSALVLAVAAGMTLLLGRNFARLFEKLRSSITRTARSMDELVSQLATTTAEQTAAAGEQASALNETSATASEVGQAASLASQRATALVDGGSRAEDASKAGLDSVGSAMHGMREVREQMSAIANAISALSDRAAAIGDIASTVALLAERSNLLALNAAIEAARAGTQGRGFSVVAQEMRSLADGSNRSAGQVKSIIGEIQAAIARAVSDTREGEKRVQSAEHLTDRAAESIRRFAEVTREFVLVGKEIAASSGEQNVAIEQMVESISHASQAGSTQLQTTRQVEETTRQLRDISQQMLYVIGRNANHQPGDR